MRIMCVIMAIYMLSFPEIRLRPDCYLDSAGYPHQHCKGTIEEIEMPEEPEEMPEEPEPSGHWESLGSRFITEYCPACNTPPGSYHSSSGKTLKEGMVACKWLSNGTRIKIDGEEYVVQDYCGTSAIDIFRDTDSCQCDFSGKREVYVWVE